MGVMAVADEYGSWSDGEGNRTAFTLVDLTGYDVALDGVLCDPDYQTYVQYYDHKVDPVRLLNEFVQAFHYELQSHCTSLEAIEPPYGQFCGTVSDIPPGDLSPQESLSIKLATIERQVRGSVAEDVTEEQVAELVSVLQRYHDVFKMMYVSSNRC